VSSATSTLGIAATLMDNDGDEQDNKNSNNEEVSLLNEAGYEDDEEEFGNQRKNVTARNSRKKLLFDDDTQSSSSTTIQQQQSNEPQLKLQPQLAQSASNTNTNNSQSSHEDDDGDDFDENSEDHPVVRTSVNTSNNNIDPLSSSLITNDQINNSADDYCRATFELPHREYVVEDYSCAYYHRIHLHGRMYITPNYVNFRSNVLGYVTVVKIHFADITDIAKRNSAMVVPNAIEITCQKEVVSSNFFIS